MMLMLYKFSENKGGSPLVNSFYESMKLIADLDKDSTGNKTDITFLTLMIAKLFLKVKILENQLCNI